MMYVWISLSQVGKFYELYHMDAGIGVQELGLTYMKVCTMCGMCVCTYKYTDYLVGVQWNLSNLASDRERKIVLD